ncbi:MAG TPA: hypothetical protein VEI80_01595 [Candidatus Acidoferrales bacterium]|nr:hypothetical protein [Candidatus Acidoferrales bacterium]
MESCYITLVIDNSRAFARPTSLGRKKPVPESGARPTRMKASMNLAYSEATLSHAYAIPAAIPLIAPMIGFGVCRMRRMMGLYLWSRRSPSRGFSPRSYLTAQVLDVLSGRESPAGSGNYDATHHIVLFGAFQGV